MQFVIKCFWSEIYVLKLSSYRSSKYSSNNEVGKSVSERCRNNNSPLIMATAPWKQLLLNALQSNSNLKHSSYIQLVINSLSLQSYNNFLIAFLLNPSNKFQVFIFRQRLDLMADPPIVRLFSGISLYIYLQNLLKKCRNDK